MCITNILDTYQSWMTALTLIVAALTLIVAKLGVRMARDQLKQSNDIGLAQISNENNWSLYNCYDDLPSSHTLKSKYTKKQFLWRVLHLNHLNLLEVAYNGKTNGALNNEVIEQWLQKSRKWFEVLEKEEVDDDINDGKKTLKEIMEDNEEYSAKFRSWLIEQRIVKNI